jgi:hypothetical protein
MSTGRVLYWSLITLASTAALACACAGRPAPGPTGGGTRAQIRTSAGGLFAINGVEVADKFPLDCRDLDCQQPKNGYQFVVVRLVPADERQGLLSGDLGEGAFVVAANGAISQGTLSWTAFSPAGGLTEIDLFFVMPSSAQGFTLQVPGNEPVPLPSPSDTTTAEESGS